MEPVSLADDRRFMARAIEIARGGLGYVEPNPLVGAVIVAPDGRIIGEGFHRRYGGPHAEVNAVASVSEADRPLLPRSTIYVTLEPCSHFGKTPPCADLLVRESIPRVVIGSLDPFEKVSGRGVGRLREAGAEVVTGVLERECLHLNRVFMTAHTLHRPFVTLKWAVSTDGFMARRSDGGSVPVRLSTPESSMAVHALRSRRMAIMVGADTAMTDVPRLDVRSFSGRAPIKVVADRRGRCTAAAFANMGGTVIYASSCPPPESSDSVEWLETALDATPAGILESLYSRGITSVLVEGGATLLRSFLDSGLWDEARVEVSPLRLGDSGCAVMAMLRKVPVSVTQIGRNRVFLYSNSRFD